MSIPFPAFIIVGLSDTKDINDRKNGFINNLDIKVLLNKSLLYAMIWYTKSKKKRRINHERP